MTGFEIAFIGVALSMDAFAVGLTNGMEEPRMSAWKTFLAAFVYGAFQCLMPLLGYGLGSAFAGAVAKIAPWLAFALLAAIGGKMIADELGERRSDLPFVRTVKKLGMGKLLMQGVATSIDALAVGVTLLAEDTLGSLPMPVTACALLIGTVTLALSFAALELGKRVGDRISRGTGMLGGLILLAIGVKILLEGILG